MPKLTKSTLRERGIFNSHGVCTVGGGTVFIATGEHHTAMVIGLNFETDPSAAWYHHGCKCFFGDGIFRNWRERDADALRKAQAWASEKYGISDWKRDPFGGWQDARVWAAAMGAREKSDAK